MPRYSEGIKTLFPWLKIATGREKVGMPRYSEGIKTGLKSPLFSFWAERVGMPRYSEGIKTCCVTFKTVMVKTL